MESIISIFICYTNIFILPINPFTVEPTFGREKKKKFFIKFYSYFSFYAGEIYQETFFLEKILNFFFYMNEKTEKSSQK